MSKLKIKSKLKKPLSSQWEIIEDDDISIAQNGGYQWSTQKQEPVKLATPNYITTKTDGRTKPLTQKEIEDFRKHTENLKLQSQQQELAARKAGIEQSIQAQNLPLTPQNLAIETQAIGDKLRFFPNAPSDSFKGVVDDYLNPFKMIGDMASGLGSVPYNIQQGNYGQAALAVGIPLGVGALAGIGANSTKQFVNNLVNPLAGVIEKPGSLFREQVYKAIDPVAYGMKEKLKSAPKTWLKNTLAKDEQQRALEIGKQLSNLNPEYFADDITRIGQNRLDAFRVGLKLPQRYDTFEKIGENTYRIKNMNPQVGEFSSVYNDLQANDFLSSNTVYSGENPLVYLSKKHDKLTSPVIKTDFGDYSVNDLRRYLLKKGDDLPPWEQHRIVEKAKNPEFNHSVYDADRQGIMGSFRWDIKKPSFENDYKIHFQSNDLWNLNPFEKRGQIAVKGNEKLLETWYKPLENFEALSFVGGKPFNIQNNFLVDPKTYQILQKYKLGGKIKTDPKGYWNKEKGIKVKPSKIEGKGLFTNKDFLPTDIIGLAHENGQPVGIIGNYHNHSETPNAESVLIGNQRFLKPKRKLRKGEEITVDYRLQPELEQPSDFNTNSVLELPLMQQGGVMPKDELIKIDGEWHNQDIIDGLERGYRVEQRRWNSNLNRYGTVNEEEFYKKFPTEEHFILENQRRYANHIGSSRKYVPQDETLMQQGGQVRPPIRGTREQYNAYQDSLNLYKAYQEQLKYNPPQDVKQSFAATHFKPTDRVYKENVDARDNFRNSTPTQKLKWFEESPVDYWHNEKQFRQDVPEDAPLIDFYKNLTFSTPTKTGLWTTPDLFNSKIAPVDIYFGGNKLNNAAWNPVFKKPVQPIQYDGDNSNYRSKPTIIGTSQKFKLVQPIIYQPQDEDFQKVIQDGNNRAGMNFKLKTKQKQNIENIQLRQLEQLQIQLINQELQKVPFSDYFSRPRQSQESGQGKTDYFDKKTGKLLGTYKNGGKVSDWEIIFD